MTNARDPKLVKAKEEKENARQFQITEDLRWVVSTPAGRRFIWRLISACHVFRSIWDNSARIHYLEGQRNIGLSLIVDLDEVDPALIFMMAREAKELEKNEMLNERKENGR